MANSYITSTSRFKPYTFAEMLQPVQIYTDASNVVETELSNLDILANDIVGKLNPNDPEDAKTLKVYEAFKTKMDDALETFYKEGLTPDSKRALASLKSQYSKDINPINTAYERREKDLDLIRQMKFSNPYIVIEGIGQSTSAYMNGNTPEPIVVDLYKASEAAKNASIGLSKQFIEQIGLQGVEGYIGQYLMHGIKKGIDATMVKDFTDYIEAIKNDNTGELKTSQGMALYNMFEQIRVANNYDSLSPDGKNRLDAAIIEGLVSGAASDMDVSYTADNYWQIENEKLKYDINKAKLNAARNPTGDTDLTGLDLRTNTGLYKGKNYDVSTIAGGVLSTDFEPINYNGTIITNALQAYNIINQNSATIASLQKEFDTLYAAKKKALAGTVALDANGDPINIENRILADPEIAALNTELSRLKGERAILQRDLGDISLSDKEADRIKSYTSERVSTTIALLENNFSANGVVIKDSTGKVIPLSSADENSIVYVNGKQDALLTQNLTLYKQLQAYANSSHIGQITPEELSMFALMMESDLTTGVEAEKAAVIFDPNNSSKGLEDLVSTMSGNIIPLLAKGESVLITDSNGKPVKKKVLKSIISSTGAIDPAKIQKVELDFTSAERGAVKVTTTAGQVLYVDARYLGDQASAFITGSTGIKDNFNRLMMNYNASKVAKAEFLNEQLAQAAESIQNAFDLNRNPGQSFSLSNKELKELLLGLSVDDEE